MTTPTAPRAGRSTGGPPGAVVAMAVVALALFVLPLLALVARVPWGQLAATLGSPAVLAALRLSLICSLSATALSAVLGVPLAWVLARGRFPGRAAVRALVTLPMVLPPVVGGVALLYTFGREGLVGQLLLGAGIRLPFTTAGVVVAETFVAMPLLVLVTEAALRSLPAGYEEAAATLGAGRWVTFRRVTLPLVAPSVAAGAALTWARALGEFGATITFAGSLPGRTETAPLAVFQALEGDDAGKAVVLSLVMVAVSLAVLLGLRERWYPSR